MRTHFQEWIFHDPNGFALTFLWIASNMVAVDPTMMGRVAVVTGSNKGIGFHIAKQLALCGLFQHIIMACRDTALGEAARESLLSTFSATASPPAARLHVESLTVGDANSHTAFATRMEETFGKIDCLVNNAAIAFKNADPTPFAGQTKPTLDVNFRGTVNLTDALLPLLKKGVDARIVNVASMAGRLSQVSPALQKRLSSETLTFAELHEMVNAYEAATRTATHQKLGYSNSNYGMSKLALIAATKIWARENYPTIKVNCCCPGYCRTDMSSQHGTRDPADGARNAVLPATVADPPTGAYYANYIVAEW